MRENQYQAGLKKRLKSMFPGCLVTKLDSSDIQGIPDLLILYKNKWARIIHLDKVINQAVEEG